MRLLQGKARWLTVFVLLLTLGVVLSACEFPCGGLLNPCDRLGGF